MAVIYFFGLKAFNNPAIIIQIDLYHILCFIYALLYHLVRTYFFILTYHIKEYRVFENIVKILPRRRLDENVVFFSEWYSCSGAK